MPRSLPFFPKYIVIRNLAGGGWRVMQRTEPGVYGYIVCDCNSVVDARRVTQLLNAAKA